MRGYEERELAGDRGGYATLEAQAPAFYGEHISGSTVHGFVDVGRVSNSDGVPCNGLGNACSMASAGVGGRLKLGNLQLQLDVAIPLRPAARTETHDFRTHFSVLYAL